MVWAGYGEPCGWRGTNLIQLGLQRPGLCDNFS